MTSLQVEEFTHGKSGCKIKFYFNNSLFPERGQCEGIPIFPVGDHIAEIIKEDLWPNPLQYYLMGEGGENSEEDSKTENRDDFMVIVDDDGEEEEGDVHKIMDEETQHGDVVEDISSSQEENVAGPRSSVHEEPDRRDSEAEEDSYLNLCRLPLWLDFPIVTYMAL
ncbi:UNVERIFIED_CONTAM: hypothetical protein K2H54_057794 [Gekko kuhli]